MSVRAAFDYILNLHGREMTISRPGTDLSGTIKCSPGNYFRNMAGVDQTIVEGREFVISKTALDLAAFPTPRRADRLADGEIGTSVISEVREMYDVGGKILGFRVRCG